MFKEKKGECWAIIPARSGSKGIKNKNIKLLNGKPLICYSIASLKKTKIFSKIIVSSDSEKILDIARKYGAETHLREDPELSNDWAMPDASCANALQKFAHPKIAEFCFMIQCTSPFVSYKSYINAFHLLKKNPEATIFSGFYSNYFLWQPSRNNKEFYIPTNHPFKKRLGRQYRIEPQICEHGFYGFRSNNFIKANFRFFSKAIPYILTNDKEVIDINTQSDWHYASYLIKNANKSK